MKNRPDAKTWIPLSLGALALTAGMLTDLANPDLWGHLAFGHLFWTRPGFPYHDVFSYMPVKDVWVYHEWLTGAVFYPLYGGLGPWSLQALRWIMAGASLWMVFRTAAARGARPFWAAMGLALTAFAFAAGWAPVRAQAFTYLFFALLLYLCGKTRQDGKWARLWILPPLFALWCNLHGGFPAGLGLLALFAAGEAIEKKRIGPFTAVLAPCILATLINPYGLKYWQFIVSAVAMPRPEIAEWMSVPQAMGRGFKPLLPLTWILLSAASLGGFLYSRPKDWTGFLVLCACLAAAWAHIRHIVFFALAFGACAPPFLSRAFSWKEASTPNRAGAVIAVFACAVLLCINLLTAAGHLSHSANWRPPLGLKAWPEESVAPEETGYPVGALRFLAQNSLSGNILTEFDWGQFILWSLPGSRVAMDGRYETVYPPRVCEDYFGFTRGKPGWRDYLHSFPHQIAVFRPHSTARRLLASSPDWKMAYMDKGAAVFVRNPRRH